MEFNKLFCCSLETGGLALGVASVCLSILDVITGIYATEFLSKGEQPMFWRLFLDDAKEHVVRTVYFTLCLLELLFSILLIVGIVLVSILFTFIRIITFFFLSFFLSLSIFFLNHRYLFYYTVCL